MKKVCIIGLGKVGSAFAFEIKPKLYKIAGLIDNNITKAKKIAKTLGVSGIYTDINEELIRITDIFIIAVQDNNIKEVIMGFKKYKPLLKNKYFIHTSGTFTSDVFTKQIFNGSAVGSFHPAQTFPKVANKNNKLLSNIYFGIEGNIKVCKLLIKLTSDFNSKYIILSKKQKELYHLSCVVVSNFLFANFYFLKALSKSLKVSEKNFIKILEPLFEQTFKNISQYGVSNSITGPIERGDYQTIEKHLKLIHRKFKSFNRFYKEVSKIIYNNLKEDKRNKLNNNLIRLLNESI